MLSALRLMLDGSVMAAGRGYGRGVAERVVKLIVRVVLWLLFFLLLRLRYSRVSGYLRPRHIPPNSEASQHRPRVSFQVSPECAREGEQTDTSLDPDHRCRCGSGRMASRSLAYSLNSIQGAFEAPDTHALSFFSTCWPCFIRTSRCQGRQEQVLTLPSCA